ncbi:MAG: glycosyltransferase [Candidatus Omnitrophica bacterium]|nr:glycosyltransferase [Candidatus Omnitrophota bacterium]MDD5552656.1 glycosyltransferase [Candidatus Omnitrophota bacterium]
MEMTSARESINTGILPAVSFVLPTLNAQGYLGRCLKSIRSQDYPSEKLEIIVADGGSKDDTLAIAAKYACRVIPNPKVLHDSGVSLALGESGADIRFIFAADNELPGRDWVRLMIKPFQRDSGVYGAFPSVVSPRQDDSVNRYFNLTHCDPFSWFVFHNEADPRLFSKAYKIRDNSGDYVIYDFPIKRYPMIGFSQGFAVRKDFFRKPENASDDILPVIQMIEEGKKIAYVPGALIYHWHLKGFKSFLKKYGQRIEDNINSRNYGYIGRGKYLSLRRKIRQYLWVIYSLTLVFPVIDALRGVFKDRDAAWLWHPAANLCLAWMVIIKLMRKEFVAR